MDGDSVREWDLIRCRLISSKFFVRRQRQRCVLRPFLVPYIEFTAHAVSAQTCRAELTLHSSHSSLLRSLLSIPLFTLPWSRRATLSAELWYNVGRYVGNTSWITWPYFTLHTGSTYSELYLHVFPVTATSEKCMHSFSLYCIHKAYTVHSMCLTKGKGVRNVVWNFHLLLHTGVTGAHNSCFMSPPHHAPPPPPLKPADAAPCSSSLTQRCSIDF